MRKCAPTSGHLPNKSQKDPWILTLDVGTSSVRTLIFDAQGRQAEEFGSQIPYHVASTSDGGFEVEADHLVELCVETLSRIHSHLSEVGIRPGAVAICTFWHSLVGVGADDRATTPIIHLFDTRSAAAARTLAKRIDARQVHARTGCVLHPSYVPAKLLWLSEARPEAYRATRRWMSFGEYLLLKLSGRAVASISMVSGSGLWNQNENDYDSGILSVLPIDRNQLASVQEMDKPLLELCAGYRSRWPEFAGAQWYPALGDGACNNIGSGCHAADRFALMVGTSGAMRVVLEARRMEIPEGLWCYRVDRKRFILGGALSNGGLVFEWIKRTLLLPDDEEIEKELAAMMPGSHGLTFLPLFAGERSTKWRAEARAAITGISMNTRPIEILRAALESVALRFRNIYDLMTAQLAQYAGRNAISTIRGALTREARMPDVAPRDGVPEQVIASGGALLRSPAWTQMMADALERPVIACLEKEASSRGAALLTLERLGVVDHVGKLPARMGAVFEPAAAHRSIYEEELRRQAWLYRKLFEEDGTENC